jgi:general secretion pathway protein L
LRELFYLRLPDSHQPGIGNDTGVEFGSAPAEQPRQVWGERGTLGQALERAVGQRLIVFVPGSAIRLAYVDVPARQTAKVLQAAPYLLEEQLAEDVDLLHFAIGPRVEGRGYPVAVVSRERMEGWLTPFRAAALRPEALIPDLLALPWSDDSNRFSALVESGQVLLRTEAWAGLCCDFEDLHTLLDWANPAKSAILKLLIPGDQAPDFTGLDWPLELLPGYRTPLEALCRHLDPDHSINLLQGAYSQKADVGRMLRPWRYAAAAVMLWLLIAASTYALSTWSLSRELKALETANLDRFQALFPNETRIVDLGAQLNQQISLLQGSGAAGGLFGLLESASRALQENAGFRLQSLQYRDGSLYLALTGSELQALESLREWFAGQPGLGLEVQSANAGSDGVQIRLRVYAS